MARSGVPGIQRARIIAALVEVSRERGYGMVTVAHIVARSGVSRRTFYEFFGDRDACFIAAFQEAVRHAGEQVLPAFQRERSWREQIGAALLALLEFLDCEPALGGLCVVDALSAGPPVLECRARVVRALVDAVHQGHLEAETELGVSRMTAEGVVGGVLAVLYGRLEDRGLDTARGSLMELFGPLMAMIVLPYLGPEAARLELERPAPRAPRRHQRPPSNPLAGLEMRLTYRTVRVLDVIAAEPGASNRAIADAAGVHDQGQISKLLARLGHLGLVVKTGPIPGEPNAWELTPLGERVNQAIHHHRDSAPR